MNLNLKKVFDRFDTAEKTIILCVMIFVACRVALIVVPDSILERPVYAQSRVPSSDHPPPQNWFISQGTVRGILPLCGDSRSDCTFLITMQSDTDVIWNVPIHGEERSTWTDGPPIFVGEHIHFEYGDQRWEDGPYYSWKVWELPIAAPKPVVTLPPTAVLCPCRHCRTQPKAKFRFFDE